MNTGGTGVNLTSKSPGRVASRASHSLAPARSHTERRNRQPCPRERGHHARAPRPRARVMPLVCEKLAQTLAARATVVENAVRSNFLGMLHAYACPCSGGLAERQCAATRPAHDQSVLPAGGHLRPAGHGLA